MSTTATDHRKAAEARIVELTGILKAEPRSAGLDSLIAECESLASAIGAFHMEGIRFRMYNVDRTLRAGSLAVPANVEPVFAEARRHLEAAGFQTRSHQAPG